MKAIITLILILTSATTFTQIPMVVDHISGREYINQSDTITFNDVNLGDPLMDTFYVYNNTSYTLKLIYFETVSYVTVYGYNGVTYFNSTLYTGTFNGLADTAFFNVLETNKFYVLNIAGPGGTNGKCIVKILDEHLSINDASKEDVQLNVYPNPVIDYVTVQFNTENNDVPVYVYTLSGQLIYTDNTSRYVGANNVKVDFSSFNAGIYLVKVGRSTLKVIKN